MSEPEQHRALVRGIGTWHVEAIVAALIAPDQHHPWSKKFEHGDSLYLVSQMFAPSRAFAENHQSSVK
eukprot:2742688-Rhodomonas_salina.3